MASVVDGAMALFGIVAGLLLVIGTLKASESRTEPLDGEGSAEAELKKAA